MKKNILALVAGIACNLSLSAQTIQLANNKLEPVKVSMSVEILKGKRAVKVIKDSTIETFDEPTFVKLKGVEFRDGAIEVNVYSTLRKDAPEFARGFIGVAFRINDDNSKFECIYIRPANGRAGDQVRRNHSIQYFAYPDYKFQRLRKEFPEQYESYADIGLKEWIRMKIIVKGSQAKLYLNNQKEPSLIVNDLKLGTDAKGGIGLFVDVGTEGYFSDIKIMK
jgi:hypothetical protein